MRIGKTEVLAEVFPLLKKTTGKYHRYQIYQKKTDKIPLFCSGRFNSKESALQALQEFLNGDGTKICGNCDKKGK